MDEQSQKFLGAQGFPQKSRREVLRMGAVLAGAATVPFGLAHALPEAGTVMVALSKYISDAASRPLPENVMEETKHHILDSIAAMISGIQLPPGIKAVEFARNYGGEKVSTIAASSILCGPIEAALVNGELAHSDESDDDYIKSGAHPGCSVVPAALAVGEKFSATGMVFVRAIALGYDVGMRAYQSLGEKSCLIETHNLIGTFGASAACACVAGLTTQQIHWVLDYAAQQSGSGLRVWGRDTEHIEKGFAFGGMAARNGATSALLVQSGWTGLNDVFSGPDSFPSTYGPNADANKLIDQLGERYEVTLTTIKKWTTGGPVQAPLDAMTIIQKRRPFDASQVQAVKVHVAPSMAISVDNREMPDICLQHLIAVMLLDKTVTFKSAHDKERMHDPAILKERAKVTMIPEEDLEKLIPRRVAYVDITFSDGTTEHERIDAVRGSPENPMSRQDIVAKATDLMTPVLGAKACAALIGKLVSLENVKNILELRPLLQRA
jgi:2-methylcitrate dehydratase PrpD